MLCIEAANRERFRIGYLTRSVLCNVIPRTLSSFEFCEKFCPVDPGVAVVSVCKELHWVSQE